MGRLVVSEFITADGVIEDPGGGETFERGGWAFRYRRGAEGDKFKLDEILQADALLLGRRTYEGFAAAWPKMKDGVGFAEKMNGIAKYVYSKTLQSADWSNSTVIGGELAESVSQLKQGDLEILVNGSAQLAQALAEHGLVDEYRLMVFPVLLGRGKRLFAETAVERPLELLDSKTAGDCLILIYQTASVGTEQPAAQ